MAKWLCVLFALFVLNNQSVSQVLPAEGRHLNYRIIGFSSGVEASKSSRVLEIARGDVALEAEFQKRIIKRINNGSGNAVVEVPDFDQDYTWRISDEKRWGTIAKVAFHHFRCVLSPELQPAIARLRVATTASRYGDAHVFMDGTAAMYDMSGKLVWYLPRSTAYWQEGTIISDLNMTPQGTITFMAGDTAAYELDYDGGVLWKSPLTGSAEGSRAYHHEFVKTKNGHYMVFGNELVYFHRNKSVLGAGGIFSFPLVFTADDSGRSAKDYFPCETLLEYDAIGKVVWKWRYLDYFVKSDLNQHKSADSAYSELDAHANSFYFDETNKFIYISFRNINRVIKISYPGGQLVSTYDENVFPGGGLFCGEHSIKWSDKGYLYLYDNNVCNKSGLPRLVVLKETGTGNNSLKKVWDYTCDLSGMVAGTKTTNGFTRGGNVMELPDQSMFVSMNFPYSKVFIVGRDKNVLWSAVLEKWGGAEKGWEMLREYRANIIFSKQEMEQLIWHKGAHVASGLPGRGV